MTHPALILIDFQRGFSDPRWGERNNPNAEVNARALLDHWRLSGWPVFHVRHLSIEPGSPLAATSEGADFIPVLSPLHGEAVIEKSVNSAFIGTRLEQALRDAGLTDLVVAGLTTPHCVSTTCRMAANLGFSVSLVHDACASYASNADMSWTDRATALTAQMVHDTAIAHLHGEFVSAYDTSSMVARKL